MVVLPSKLKAGFRCSVREGRSWPAAVAVTLCRFLLIPCLFAKRFLAINRIYLSQHLKKTVDAAELRFANV